MAREFKLTAPEKVTFTIDLSYLSTFSARIALEITSPENCQTTINWMYEEEDTDMREQGEILQSSIKKQFKFLEKQLI